MPSNRFGSGIRILAELGQVVAPGAHGIVLMDEAGWHTASDQLTVRLRLKDHLTLRRKQFLLDITPGGLHFQTISCKIFWQSAK